MLPFACEQAVEVQIDKVVVEPFPLSNDPFLLESQTLWNGTTPHIANGTTNLDFIQHQPGKGVVYHRTTCVRHQTPALKFCTQPVPDLYFAVHPIHRMITDRACRLTSIPETTRHRFVFQILRLC